MLSELKNTLQALANPERAATSLRYFRTGPGQYGEGDVFLGISVPQLRQVARKFQNLGPDELHELLESPIHEHRLVALVVLVSNFKESSIQARREWCEFYLSHLHRVNNWDLVDVSARDILGEFLFNLDRSLLDALAATEHLWSQRAAIVATQAFIRRGQFADTFRLAETYLAHPHDLIHKATGWMLREVGGKNVDALREFLDEFAPRMPRTMLRYAIEKLPEAERQAYLRQAYSARK